MNNRSEFFYAAPPSIRDHGLFAVVLVHATAFTAIGVASLIDRDGSVQDLTTVWILALLGWVGAVFAGVYLQRLRSAFKLKEVALSCDHEALTARAWTGKLTRIPWSNIRSFEIEEKKGRFWLLLQTTTDNGSVSLDRLSERPTDIFRALQQISERSN